MENQIKIGKIMDFEKLKDFLKKNEFVAYQEQMPDNTFAEHFKKEFKFGAYFKDFGGEWVTHIYEEGSVVKEIKKPQGSMSMQSVLFCKQLEVIFNVATVGYKKKIKKRIDIGLSILSEKNVSYDVSQIISISEYNENDRKRYEAIENEETFLWPFEFELRYDEIEIKCDEFSIIFLKNIFNHFQDEGTE